MPMKLDNARNRFIAAATGAYLIFALAWIFLSDQLLASFTDISSLIWLSTAKGLFFIVSTSGFFFVALQAGHLHSLPMNPVSLEAWTRAWGCSGRRAGWCMCLHCW